MAKSKATNDKTTSSSEEHQTSPVVRIKEIRDNPHQKTGPIIGYFPSGYDPLKNPSEPSVKVHKSSSSRNPKNPRMQVTVGAGGSSQVNFVGTNYSGEATAPQLCNYALGVFDKETRVLQMVPIAANRIFRLDPKIAELERPENELPAEATEDLEKDAKFRNLTLMYSTKTNIRRDEKRETLRQTGDAGMQEDMDNKLKGIKINTEALEAIDPVANSRNIPLYDLGATEAEMAYPLDKIILYGEWDYLLDIFELAQAGSEVNPDVYPSFVCNRLLKLETLKDDGPKRRLAGILSYISHLIRFKDKHTMDGVSSGKRHKLPGILQQKFSSMFGITNNKRIPDEKQKLLISYVLVLSLFADDFRSDPSDIAKDLRMNPIMLRSHYEYLGCKFVRENQVLVATLPVPLEFQTFKRKRRQR